MNSTIEYPVITSSFLASNVLGDAHVRTLPIYLPPSYNQEPERRYPVVWMLTGYTGRGQMLLNDSLWSPTIQQQVDALIAQGMPEIIMALPDCATSYGGSQYLNSTATGRYEDYLIDELVPFVDACYRTMPGGEHRGVMGKSSGGYGAMIHGMRHPDVFGAVACHSGDMAFDLCYRPDFPKLLSRLARNDHDPAAFVREFLALRKKTDADVTAMNVLAMAACYSPNPGAHGLPIDFPVDLYSCELRPEVWARWLEHDPVELVGAAASKLKQLRLLFIDCGLRDDYNLQYGARIMARRLEANGVPFEHEEFDDDHGSIGYRYDVSLPKIVRRISV